MNYNNKNNFSKNKYLIKQKDGIKTSLSFNNININNPNITYNIENSINDLFMRRINEFSFGATFQSKHINNSNERKINFINVNNYFNPQINIIKVNKLNEPKKSIIKNNNNKLITKKYLSNRNKDFKSINIEKLKIIQLWWKDINKIIKIQKYIRGFIFRNKLLEILEKEERAFYNILEFYKIIKKIFATHSFRKIKAYFLNKKVKNNNNFKSKFINNKKLLKTINDNNIENKFILGNERLTINKNNKKTNINNYKNFSRNIIKKKKENIPKSFERVNIIYNIKESNKPINDKNNKKEEPKIKISKLSRNKNNFNSNLIGYTNTNKKYNNNIIFENNNYNRKNNKKPLTKSRNKESNNTYFYQNYSKNNINSKIMTDNNQFMYSTNKNLNINKLKNNKNIGQTTKSKILPKKFFNYNNLIIDNPNTERNNSIKIKELLNNKTMKKKILINNDLSKKYNINNIKNCFSLWKEITEKKAIIKYLNNNYKYNRYNNTFYKKNNSNKIKQKMEIKIQNLKKIILKKGLGLLIKKILNKCTLYKYFILFSYYTDKINIFQKLKNYLISKSKLKTHIKITKLVDSINKGENKYPTLLAPNSTKYKKEKIRNKIINNNKNKISLSYSYINKTKTKLSFNEKCKNLNNSNQNLKCPKIKINRIIYNNLFKKENNNKKKDKKFKENIVSFDYKLIMQINQLKMIFNLIELKRKQQKSLIKYFNKWKNNIKYYSTIYNFRPIKNKFLIEDDFSPRERITAPISKYRNHSYSSKDKKIYTKIKFKKYNDYNYGIKLNTDRNHFTNNNINDSINMIYKKKYIGFGSKTTRINIINDNSSLLQFKKLKKRNKLKEEKNYSHMSLNKNVSNSIIPTLYSNSCSERFYKKIEEREIFFNKGINRNNQHNIKSLKNYKKNDSSLAINSYYKKMPIENITCGNFYSYKKPSLFNKKPVKKELKRIKTFDCVKKGYFYDFFFRLLIPRKKTF